MRRLLCLALACCFALAAADCGGPLVKDPVAAAGLRVAWPSVRRGADEAGLCSDEPPAWMVAPRPSIDAGTADAGADVQTSEPSVPAVLQSPSQPAAPAAAHVDVVSADAAAAVADAAVAVVVDGGKGAPR